MSNERAEQLAFNATQEAITSQNKADPGAHYILLPDPAERTFAVCRRLKAPTATNPVAFSEPVKGLVFDTFHIGQGQHVRDALNRAYAEGVAAEVERRSLLRV